MNEVDQMIMLEKFLMHNNINFTRRPQDFKVSYVIEVVKEFDDDEYSEKIEKHVVIVNFSKNSIFLYIPVFVKAFDQEKLQQLLEYTVRVNNILETGILQYNFDEKIFRYKMEHLFLHSSNLTNIIDQGVDCLISVGKIFTEVLNNIIIHNTDIMIAFDFTHRKLSEIDFTFHNIESTASIEQK
jgi:hypothetical protein